MSRRCDVLDAEKLVLDHQLSKMKKELQSAVSDVSLSVSIGGISLDLDSMNIEDSLMLADERMYEVKKQKYKECSP